VRFVNRRKRRPFFLDLRHHLSSQHNIRANALLVAAAQVAARRAAAPPAAAQTPLAAGNFLFFPLRILRISLRNAYD
jgi:hypothetical protein